MKHPKSSVKLSKADQQLMLVHFIEKSMRKLTKIIKEKKKLVIKKGQAYDAILNSYNISMAELKQYETKRDEVMQLAKNTSKKTFPV